MTIMTEPKLAIMSCGVLFEDFFDNIGIGFDVFRKQFRGSWIFEFSKSIKSSGTDTVIIFTSSRVSRPVRFTHEPSRNRICILPSPTIHRLYRYIINFIKLPNRGKVRSLDSYIILPILSLIKELKNEKCTIIVCQDYENPSFDITVFLGWLIGLPVFAVFQGENAPRSRIDNFTRGIALRRCAGLIIATKEEIRRVHERYVLKTSRVAQIFNPIDVGQWHSKDREAVRSELGIGEDERVAIFHGRVDIKQKGLDLCLYIWKQLYCERQNKLRLLIVGTGGDAKKFEDMLNVTKVKNVTWVREFILDQNEIRKYLSSADVYILPSMHEGFPVAPLEAMACGLPVIASDRAGLNDIANFQKPSGVVIVPTEEYSAMANAIARILDDDLLRHEMGRSARKTAEENFSLEIIGRQLRDFLLKSC
jgi:glycosyltransferase involved in cell wall biosynthesis